MILSKRALGGSGKKEYRKSPPTQPDSERVTICLVQQVKRVKKTIDI